MAIWFHVPFASTSYYCGSDAEMEGDVKVLITGGGGFIGQRLAARLLAEGQVPDRDGRMCPIERLTLFDVAEPASGMPDDRRLTFVAGDIGEPAAVSSLIDKDTGLVVHLAAVVSAGAEADFDLGMRVNLDGTRHVLAACRAAQTRPRVVFSSSVAAFGGPVSTPIGDQTILWPQTSYGIQKSMGEHLVADFSRKGFVDGRSMRLPTVIVRPGKPNKAASTWASSIMREPLQGQYTVCPVTEDQAMWCLSARRVVDAFIHAITMSETDWGGRYAVNIPGNTFTVREMVDALIEVAGQNVANRIQWEPDPEIQAIVSGWPPYFDPQRGVAMGFQRDTGMNEIIEAFIEDELDGTFAA